MFPLSLIEHDLPMPPHLLSRPLPDAIKAELERLFLDKVIADLGLCVSVYDGPLKAGPSLQERAAARPIKFHFVC
ncbi:unnamed protein product [Urochloa humidicola]